MNKFAKTIFATSAAVFITISTNSYSYTEGEGIGGRTWVVDQAKHNAVKVEDNKRITDSMRDKAERI